MFGSARQEILVFAATHIDRENAGPFAVRKPAIPIPKHRVVDDDRLALGLLQRLLFLAMAGVVGRVRPRPADAVHSLAVRRDAGRADALDLPEILDGQRVFLDFLADRPGRTGEQGQQKKQDDGPTAGRWQHPMISLFPGQRFTPGILSCSLPFWEYGS